MAHKNTRKNTEHVLFGQPCDLPTHQLPTLGDCLRLIWNLKCQEEKEIDFKISDKKDAIKQAALEISSLWEKAIGDRKTVPLISQKAIEARLKRKYDKGIELIRTKNKKDVPKYEEELNSLFDICSCDCSPASCQDIKCRAKKCDGYHLDCQCDIKVPKIEIQFLLDQRSTRKMKVEGIDRKVSTMWERSEERENKEADKANESEQAKLEDSVRQRDAQKEFELLDEYNEQHAFSESTDTDYLPKVNVVTAPSQNRTLLPKTAEACDRYLVSDRAGAAIACGVLTDYGIITDGNTTQVIGPRKIHDARHKFRMERVKKDIEDIEEITSLYFDGKKTSTRVLKKNEKTGKWSPRHMIEDHYVLIVEPGSQYLTHVTPKSGHGITLAGSIYKCLDENNWKTQPIVCIGADGTNSNVGAENGAIHYLEMMLGKPLHYLICQLHGNELPFRAVFYYYDGKPSGPEHWRGPIGRRIKESVSNLVVVDFQPIQFSEFPSLPDDIVADLSWDQKYLYRICMALIHGTVDDDLAAIEPGPPCVSRWNTLWSRICRLYAGTQKPSSQLKRVVNMIVKFSAPMWFYIKIHPLIIDGPLNTFRCLQLLKNLNAEEKRVAKKAVQRNAFFAHSDQLLLAMCADNDETIRQKAVTLIQKVRINEIAQEVDSGSEESDHEFVDEDLILFTDDESDEDENENINNIPLDRSIREVHVPKLKFQAHSYHNMINWRKELQSEPPFIARLSDNELIKILESPLQVPKWKNNTQAVERGIKLITEACTSVTGQAERDGFIRQRMHSRKLMPKFNSKKDYNVKLNI